LNLYFDESRLNQIDILLQAVTRGLPADHTGPIRVVSMAGDENMCCGTHVDTLGRIQVTLSTLIWSAARLTCFYLQMVKLLAVAQVKKKTQIRFVAGDRVLKDFDVRLERERVLSKLLQWVTKCSSSKCLTVNIL
jgi:hypothetical protein